LVGTNYLTVTFTDESTNDPTSWLWNFGDGTTSTEQNPVHTFLGAGSYTITLTAANDDGYDVETKEDYITLDGASTRIRIVKYADDGATILAEMTVTNRTMEETLPVLGDGSTHYYHQGPVFLDSGDQVTEELLRWNVKEDNNYNSDKGDYNAVKGTNMKDLLDLVGPIPAGSRIEVKATDGFSKSFAYRNVYDYSAREGPMVVTWWRPDDGYVPFYTSGMRLIWFADTSVNPLHVHAFGNWDWHEAANPHYWYWYTSGSEKYPTTTGLSVQMVSEISIYTDIPAPDADFKINRTSEHQDFTSFSCVSPCTVQFIDWSTGDPTSWSWDLDGDGDIDSMAERPVYTYTSTGSYSVSLTVANAGGQQDTETKPGCIVVGTPTMEIQTTGGITNWQFVPGTTHTDTTSVDISINTNTDKWHVTAKDALNDGKPAGTAGFMAEYTGSAYVTNGQKLANAIRVRSLSNTSWYPLSGTDKTLHTGSTPGTYQFDVGLRQQIVSGDSSLTPPNIYRVVITYTGYVD
jgi:PKD repeat protein